MAHRRRMIPGLLERCNQLMQPLSAAEEIASHTDNGTLLLLKTSGVTLTFLLACSLAPGLDGTFYDPNFGAPAACCRIAESHENFRN